MALGQILIGLGSVYGLVNESFNKTKIDFILFIEKVN